MKNREKKNRSDTAGHFIIHAYTQHLAIFQAAKASKFLIISENLHLINKVALEASCGRLIYSFTPLRNRPPWLRRVEVFWKGRVAEKLQQDQSASSTGRQAAGLLTTFAGGDRS
jgi:hypothetical protein